MKTAWLIGAGFSYEFGMPLVSELTRELLSWLTPAKLRELNAGWTSRNDGHPPALIEEFASVLERGDLHYEQIIGWLQEEGLKPKRHKERRDLHKLAAMLQDCVGRLLLTRQLKRERLFQEVLPWFGGLADHVPDQAPLWVFSLNHDVCVEMLGAELGIDVRCGYKVATTKLLTSTGEERALDRLTREEIAAGTLDFGPPDRRGINLVKLHGSLDVFGYDELTEYLRIRPMSPGAAGWLEAIKSAENDFHALHDGQPFKVMNEICTRDITGEIQFLRRTPVAGMRKFDRQLTYNAPAELIAFFGRKLDDFDRLVVIGYGWGDKHINGPVEAWLAHRPEARIIVVNPGGLPAGMQPVANRCDVRSVPAAEYVSEHRWATISKADHLKRRLMLKVRHDPAYMNRCAGSMSAMQAEITNALVASLKDGHGRANDEELLARVPSFEVMLEKLLAHMEREGA
jgi:hypothetical protein